MKTLTIAQATDTLHAIVEEFGADHRYRPALGAGTTCLYTTRDNEAEAKRAYDDGSGTAADMIRSGTPTGPGCLIGLMLHRLGWSLEDLAKFDNVGSIAHVIDNSLLVVETPLLGRALKQGQAVQDLGHPWGEAVDKFDEVMAGVYV